MVFSRSAGVVAFVAGEISKPANAFEPKLLGVKAPNPFVQIAIAPNRAIAVANVADARKTFAEVEIQGESLGSALTRTVNGW
jgi:hypothetical protein